MPNRNVPDELGSATADVLALRLARSPLWETMEALRVTREPARQACHLSAGGREVFPPPDGVGRRAVRLSALA